LLVRGTPDSFGGTINLSQGLLRRCLDFFSLNCPHPLRGHSEWTEMVPPIGVDTDLQVRIFLFSDQNISRNWRSDCSIQCQWGRGRVNRSFLFNKNRFLQESKVSKRGLMNQAELDLILLNLEYILQKLRSTLTLKL